MANNKVIILSGVSGVGKSTYAEKILTETQGVKVSADHYFMGDDGYVFDPSKLEDAHADCFRRFIDFCQKNISTIIVDNTNTTTEEIFPYVLGAQAFGYDYEIVTLYSTESFTKLAKRNIHGVSHNTIIAQHNNIFARYLPSWWNQANIHVP